MFVIKYCLEFKFGGIMQENHTQETASSVDAIRAGRINKAQELREKGIKKEVWK